MYWGLAGTLGTQGPEGYRGHQGHWGAPRGGKAFGDVRGVSKGVRGVLGASRDSRNSGTRRGIGASGALGDC